MWCSLQYLVRHPRAIGELELLGEPLTLRLLILLFKNLKLTPALVRKFRATGHETVLKYVSDDLGGVVPVSRATVSPVGVIAHRHDTA